jgi:hypothetical protein
VTILLRIVIALNAAFGLLICISPPRFLVLQRWLATWGQSKRLSEHDRQIVESRSRRTAYRICGLIYFVAAVAFGWFTHSKL